MCRWRYISIVKGEALPQPIFAPPWIHPLEYLAETTTRMVAFQVFLAFCLWSSLRLRLALPWIHPRVDLIKSLNTCAGHENFIPTKSHKHPSICSVVKADYVCSNIYTCIHAWSCLQTKEGQTNFISSGSKIVKRLRRRQCDPAIIDGTIGIVLSPFTQGCNFIKFSGGDVGSFIKDSRSPQENQRVHNFIIVI